MQLIKTLSIALLVMLLSACGEGIDVSTDTTTTDSTAKTDLSNPLLTDLVDLTARLLDCPTGWNKDITQCTEATEISAIKPGVVAVSLSQSGIALTSQIVTATVSKGELQPDTALTNSSGVAFFTLLANGDEGAGRLTLTTDAAEQETTSALNFDISGNLVTLSISSTSVTDAALVTLTASVTNAGVPVSGEVVNFGSTLGALSPLSGTALTNASGIATITLTAGETAGAGVASATLDNSAKATIAFETTGYASDATFKYISLSMDVSLITEATPATVTAIISDGNGPVAGEVIEFTSSIGVVNPVSGTALTNADGEATITLTAGDVAGAGLLQASLMSGELNSIGFETTGDASAVSSKIVKLSAISSMVTDAYPATVTVTVSDGTDPLAGQIVEFSSLLGVLDPVSGTALTDAAGEATITLMAGDVAGAGLLRASLSSGEFDSIGFATAGDAPLVSGNSVTLSISSTLISDADALPTTLTATVTDENGVVAGEVVNFGSTLGALSPLSGTALTNASGEATITLTAGETAGAGVASATLDNSAKATVGFETAGDESFNVGKIIVVTPITAVVDDANPVTIIVTVTENGENLANEVVNFTSTLGGFNPTSGTALTGDNGEATIELTAGDVPGAGIVTASLSSGESDTGGFTTLGDDSGLLGKVVTLDPVVGSISDAAYATISVLVEENGSALANEVVYFSSSLGVFDSVSATSLTDKDGIALIKLNAGSVQGAGIITAKISSGELDSVGFFTDGDTPLVLGNEVSLSISFASVSDTNSATLTATVKNAGVAVEGEVVNFGSTLGALSPLSGTALTNASGEATITLTAGETAGAGVASATLDNSAKATVGFETAGDESSNLGKIIVVTPITTVVDDANPVTIIVTVTQNGWNLANEVVHFTSTLGGFNPISGTALTGDNGEATIELTAGDVEGAGIVTASLSSGESDTGGFTTLGDDSGLLGKVVTLDPVVGSISDAAYATISVLVEENGSALANEVVNFSSSLGVFDPVSGTALTNALGKATIKLTAGTVVGAGIITATINSGELDSIGFATDGDAPFIEGKEVLVSVVNKSISASSTSEVTAYVAENGFPVANEVVNFASTLGLLNPVSGTALTGADGYARVTLTAGTVKGAGVVTATLSNGATANDSFATEGDEIIGINIVVRLEDVNGDAIDTINTTTSGKIIATVNGLEAGKQVLVTFSSEIGDIPITTAISDSVTNEAFVDIYAGNNIGAGTITATLRTGEFGEDLIIVGAAGLEIGSTVVGLSPISAGGSTNITVTIIDTNNNNAPYTEPVIVNFSSSCSLDEKVILDEQVTTFQGIAVSSYLAQGCIGTDIITVTANAGTENLSSSVEIDVEEADVGSIEFVSVSKENLSLKGAGTADMPEYSTVIFRVLDVNGLPADNQFVDFSLNTDVGGITLSTVQAQTNLDGLAQVVVNAGTVATPVRVTASVVVGSSLIATQSNLMVISTGIPDQDSFSLTASIYNIEGYRHDGRESVITARLADGFNNLAPDGTAVSFTAEGGAIEPSCITENGTCSVTFISQNPRPIDSRVTILAYAVGEESFPDLNGNGLYDSGDPDSETAAFLSPSIIDGKAYDLPEAFLDNNENGSRDADEKIFDFDTSGDYTAADEKYNGSLCNESTSVCTDQKSVHVRGDLVIVLAGSFGDAVVTKEETVDSPVDNDDATVSIAGKTIGKATVFISGPAGQPLPADTIIKFSTSAGSIVSDDTFIWPNENSNSGRSFSVEVEGDDEAKTGTLYVEVEINGSSLKYDSGIIIDIY